MNAKVLELERKIKELESIIDTQKKATDITYIKKIKGDTLQKEAMKKHKQVPNVRKPQSK